MPSDKVQAAKALAKWGDAELLKVLVSEGLMENPVVIRMFANAMNLYEGRVTVEELDNRVSGNPNIPGVKLD